MCFGKLHVEFPSVDLGFFGLVDALAQFVGLLVVLLVKGQQVGGHVLHGGVILLSLQGVHAGDLGGRFFSQGEKNLMGVRSMSSS
jgi:hypothetical protein